jgi:signal transduction histidine kinase
VKTTDFLPPLVNLFDVFEKHPKPLILAEAFVALALFAFIDIITIWQFSMFVFYCMPVFVVALRFSRRVGIGFVIFSALVATAANYDTVQHLGLGGFAWTGVNRLIGFLFAAACGMSIRDVRKETVRRLDSLEHARELEREIVRAGEREQMRIGHDLHDGLCQTLAALDCASQCLKLHLEAECSPRANLAAEIKKGLSDATLEARNLARGIYPASLEADGLINALRDLVLTTNALYNGLIHFEGGEEIVVQDPELALHLYRITQEAMSNALRHANATRVQIRIVQENRRLRITVSDDGCGSALQVRSSGMGLNTMRYRAKLIGAEFKIDTGPSKGTTVCCSLAL